jgi:hypothetical protein
VLNPNPFPIPAIEDGHPCCNGLHYSIELEALKAEEVLIGLDVLERRKRTAPEHAPFDELELALLTALIQAYNQAADIVAGVFTRALEDGFDEDNPEDFDWTLLVAASQDAENEMLNIWRSLGMAGLVGGILGSLVEQGGADVGTGLLFADSVVRQQVVAAVLRSAEHYTTNGFFNRHVVPAIVREIEAMISGTRKPSLAAVRAVLDQRLKSVPYWRVVANATASRAYHYGLTKAAMAQGFREYIFVATMDDKTSEICAYLDGSRWRLADAVDTYERASLAEAEEVPNVHPWFTPPSKASGVSMEEAAEAYTSDNMPLPPLHGNCRSTITPV